ncbi:hypothetical protein FD754_004228 [Muntiacus muntjak]|uniref:Uncharacterized protein n=1 Tax=Muntiacus muntjak TaxID=9888 RepID=A0A5N3WEB6_MUNMU|nr:hypothetical protein FD754_004228 [Muntiacus muntjak]
MQLLVHAWELHTLEVTSQETVAQIKCGVEALSTLEIAGRMLGGEVHGSLAHAGKVRGQTPKGHLRYNQCFVSAGPTFGKKKGPNANS